jgi:hypothetical protein
MARPPKKPIVSALGPFELASKCWGLQDMDWPAEKIAVAVDRSVTHVRNLLRLRFLLPDDRDRFERSELSIREAFRLVGPGGTSDPVSRTLTRLRALIREYEVLAPTPHTQGALEALRRFRDGR